MNDYKYTLERYNGMKTRYNCPNCNKKRTFTRYLDTETNEHLSEEVGKCNREIKCGYHYKPKQYFDDNNISFDTGVKYTPIFKPIVKPVTSFINIELLEKSKNKKQVNYFIDYLASLWDYDIAYYLSDKYNIGTSKNWKGSTVFWQKDIKGKVRTGKVMLYDKTNGKRIKKPYNHINWVHKILNIEGFNLEQCYFGEHLLSQDKNKPVAIVESEKTAIICSIYLPEFIWLACGSLNNLNKEKTKALKGRTVFLFPALGCYDLWNDKIKNLTTLATFYTSSLLKDKATEEEKTQGLDIADYLIKINKDNK